MVKGIFTKRVQKIGNSLGFIIPNDTVKMLNLKPNVYVKVELEVIKE